MKLNSIANFGHENLRKCPRFIIELFLIDNNGLCIRTGDITQRTHDHIGLLIQAKRRPHAARQRLNFCPQTFEEIVVEANIGFTAICRRCAHNKTHACRQLKTSEQGF